MKISVLFSIEISMIDAFKIVDKILHRRMKELKLDQYLYSMVLTFNPMFVLLFEC